MAKKIQARTNFRPRLESMSSVEQDELIERIAAATNQSCGILLAAFPELDVQIQSALKSGRGVHPKAVSVTNHRQESGSGACNEK